MTRVNAIVLLILALFATTHTTLSFHFCGGDFRTVDIAGAERLSCCGGENHHEYGADDSGTAIHGVPCCANHYLEISVDDFSPSQLQNIVGSNSGCSCTALFTSSAMADFGHIFAADACHRIFPPPGSFAKAGAELLAMICILRI